MEESGFKVEGRFCMFQRSPMGELLIVPKLGFLGGGGGGDFIVRMYIIDSLSERIPKKTQYVHPSNTGWSKAPLNMFF